MSESKHIPGPWMTVRSPASRHAWLIYKTHDGSNGVGTAIATTGRWTPSDFEEESEANARLIAAAPTMYEALQAVVSACREGAQNGFADWFGLDRAEQMARAAIAAADVRM